MDFRKVIKDFYHEFEKMNVKGVLSHCAPHAMVNSPTLGKKEAERFYPEIFSKARRIKIVLKDLFVNPDHPQRLAAYVDFTMTWKGEETGSNFEGVAIFDLTLQGKIQHIEVIYDAQRARDELARVS